jgi:hypothetical protein
MPSLQRPAFIAAAESLLSLRRLSSAAAAGARSAAARRNGPRRRGRTMRPFYRPARASPAGDRLSD